MLLCFWIPIYMYSIQWSWCKFGPSVNFTCKYYLFIVYLFVYCLLLHLCIHVLCVHACIHTHTQVMFFIWIWI